MIFPEMVDQARSLLETHRWMKRTGYGQYEELRDNAHVAAAKALKLYVMDQLLSGRHHVHYCDLADLFRANRFEVGQILRQSINYDTKRGSVTLWASFVGYKRQVRDFNGRVLYRAGEPGSEFYSAAKENGWKAQDKDFLQTMRWLGREVIRVGAAL